MYEVYTDNGQKIDIHSLNLLSTDGSEVNVYNDETLVYKMFKENYSLTHKTVEGLNFLSSIPTQRILMPQSKLFKNGKLVGYTMPFISHPKNIKKATMAHFLEELRILQQDIDILTEHNVRLIDLNLTNFVYNGGLYIIDPGNYKINDIENMLYHENGKTYLTDYQTQQLTAIESLDEETKQNAIRKWNYHKANELLQEILFMHTRDIDFYTLRAIIKFLKEKRVASNELFDLPSYETYFKATLPVDKAVKTFVKQHIEVNQQEKEALSSFLTR